MKTPWATELDNSVTPRMLAKHFVDYSKSTKHSPWEVLIAATLVVAYIVDTACDERKMSKPDMVDLICNGIKELCK